MNQGLLFGDSEEGQKTESEIEWELRRLKQAWVYVEDAGKLEEIRNRIRTLTRKLGRHPDWWSVPTCECRECREYDESLEREGVR